MTPKEIVAYLNKHIVGQADAKRAIAIAMRNRCHPPLPRTPASAFPLSAPEMPEGQSVWSAADSINEYEQVAPHEAPAASQGGGDAQEYPDDRPHWGGKDGGGSPTGKACGGTLHQGDLQLVLVLVLVLLMFLCFP